MPDAGGSQTWVIEALSSPAAQPVAVLFSALVAGVLAWWAIRTNRSNSRDVTTLNLIHTTAWDADFIKVRELFRKLRTETTLASFSERPGSPEFQAILKMLNHYELISIGIRQSIISAPIYARYYRSRFVLDWWEAKPFVEALRAKVNKDGSEAAGNKLFNEYQNLAEQWADEHNIYVRA